MKMANSLVQNLFNIVFVASSVFSLLFHLPIWIIKYSLFPSLRGRPSWTFYQQMLVSLLRWMMDFIAHFDSLTFSRDLDQPPVLSFTLSYSHVVSIEPVGREMLKGVVEQAANDVGGLEPVLKSMNGRVGPRRIPGYWYAGEKADKEEEMVPLKGTDEDLVLLFFHGGAYSFGTGHEEDMTAVIAKDLVERTPITRVLSIDYRLASIAPFPAALIDALSGYSHLINECKIPPHRILIGGDSAGGHLTLCLARYLRDEKVMPMPAGLLLLSPWCDMSQSHHVANSTAHTNARSDYVTGKLGDRAIARFMKGHAASFRTNPYISPGSLFNTSLSTFAFFPPTYIIAGGAEMLLTEIQHTASLLSAGIGAENVVLNEVPDAPHDVLVWQRWGTEREKAIERLEGWLKERFPAAAKAKERKRAMEMAELASKKEL